jgi:hypothetical protein
MKLAIDDLTEKENNLFEDHLNSIRALLIITPNDEQKQALLDKLTSMETKSKEKDYNKRNKRKQWLESLKTNKAQNNKEITNKPLKPNPEKEEKKKSKKHRRFVKRNTWKRVQDKKKMETITSVYNYSDLTLTEGMTRILNRGLNFCITPISLNITEVLVDYRKFERKMK